MNPYQSPRADFGGVELPGRLAGMTPKAVQKLYFRSSNINAIVGLLVIGIVVLAVMMFAAGPGMEMSVRKLAFMVALLFLGSTAIGLAMRTAWGRVLGIIACTVSLISIPFGTIMGIMGLVAFFQAKILFGPDRVTHKVLALAYKELKRAKMFPFWGI